MSRIVPRYRVHELRGIPNLHKKYASGLAGWLP